MTRLAGNLFQSIPVAGADELFANLLVLPGVRIERIVSHGQATPSGEWYDQGWDEWVVLLAGSAGLLLDGESAARELLPGDYLLLPAGCRHRVEWTASGQATIWLAVHVAQPVAGAV